MRRWLVLTQPIQSPKQHFLALSLSLGVDTLSLSPHSSFSLITMSAAVPEPVFNRAALEQLLGKRFFYAPAFSLYGGNKDNNDERIKRKTGALNIHLSLAKVFCAFPLVVAAGMLFFLGFLCACWCWSPPQH